MKKTGLRKNWWKYLLTVIIICIYLLPLYTLFVMSLKSLSENTSRLTFPSEICWENYINVFLVSDILNAMKNTIILSVGTTLLTIVFSSIAAYPLARVGDRIGKLVNAFLLGVMMVPGMTIVVGVYSTLVSIKAVSTYWGMIAVCTAFALPHTIYTYSRFITSIPISLDEAAAVDGADPFTTFFKVILPQLKPVTATLVIMRLIGAWNEYGYAIYILQQPKMYNISLVVKQYWGAIGTDLNGAAACALVAILPITIVYILMQKYFTEGSIDSAVKG